MEKSPDAFRTIREVSDWLDTPTHVLRFWETKFHQIAPVKRTGGRRYYRPRDMLLLGGIKKMLHEDGHTIKAVQKILSKQGIQAVTEHSKPLSLVRMEPEPQRPEIDPNLPPVDQAIARLRQFPLDQFDNRRQSLRRIYESLISLRAGQEN